MTYYPFPLYEVAGYWAAKGQPLYELIEPVDGYVFLNLHNTHTHTLSLSLSQLLGILSFVCIGNSFHPSQITNALIAEYLFGLMSKQHPNLVGPLNPNNAAILQMFGSQRKY
jgi:hypothetical protein